MPFFWEFILNHQLSSTKHHFSHMLVVKIAMQSFVLPAISLWHSVLLFHDSEINLKVDDVLCEYRNITNTADQLRHKGDRFLIAVISQTICKLLCHILHSVYAFEFYKHIIYIILLFGFGIHLLAVQFTGTNLVYCPLCNGHWYNDILYFVLQ